MMKAKINSKVNTDFYTNGTLLINDVFFIFIAPSRIA